MDEIRLPDDPDEQLLDELRALAAAADPVPPTVVASAKGSWTWRTVDAELAALTWDSVLEEPALSGVRGAGDVRALTFELDDTTVEVEVEVDAGRRDVRMVGLLAPPAAGRVVLVNGDASADAAIDALGRFAVGPVPPGPVRLRLELADGRVISTEWTTV